MRSSLWLLRHRDLGEVRKRIEAKTPRPKLTLPRAARRLERMTVSGPRSTPESAGILVLPVFGVIDWCADWSCDTDLSWLAGCLRDAVADSRVQQIVLWVNSPGGAVTGVEETASLILSARSVKPITAYIDGLCCSAAYWLASACSRIIALPSSEVGSVGVYSVLEDRSRQYQENGIDLNIWRAPPGKTALSGLEPPSDEGSQHAQRLVDDCYQRFVNVVAKGRGLTRRLVERDFGGGMTLTAEEGMKVGMLDALGMPDDFATSIGNDVQRRYARKLENQRLRARRRAEYNRLAAECRRLARS